MTLRTRAVAIGTATAAALALSAAPALAAKTITVTTPQADPFSFRGMPKTLKAGTYRFRYVNRSGVGHNLKVGSKATPVFPRGTKTITVTLKKGTVRYLCVPHRSVMKGVIRVR